LKEREKRKQRRERKRNRKNIGLKMVENLQNFVKHIKLQTHSPHQTPKKTI
jgi:hypothetical protein